MTCKNQHLQSNWEVLLKSRRFEGVDQSFKYLNEIYFTFFGINNSTVIRWWSEVYRQPSLDRPTRHACSTVYS